MVNYRLIILLILVLFTVFRTGTFSLRHYAQNNRATSCIGVHQGHSSEGIPYQNDNFNSMTSMNKICLSEDGLAVQNYIVSEQVYFDLDKVLFLNFSSPPFRPPC